MGVAYVRSLIWKIISSRWSSPFSCALISILSLIWLVLSVWYDTYYDCVSLWSLYRRKHIISGLGLLTRESWISGPKSLIFMSTWSLAWWETLASILNHKLPLVPGVVEALSRATPTICHTWVGFLSDFQRSLSFHNSSHLFFLLSHSIFWISVDGLWICVRHENFSFELFIFLSPSDIFDLGVVRLWFNFCLYLQFQLISSHGSFSSPTPT
jgi:hypothetical protein